MWDHLNEENIGSCEVKREVTISLSHITRTLRRLETRPDSPVTLAKL